MYELAFIHLIYRWVNLLFIDCSNLHFHLRSEGEYEAWRQHQQYIMFGFSCQLFHFSFLLHDGRHLL